MARRPPTPTLFPYTTLFRSSSFRMSRLTSILEVMPSCRAWSTSSALKSERSEEHTSELQSLTKLACRRLLEKKKRRYRTRTRVAPPPADAADDQTRPSSAPL